MAGFAAMRQAKWLNDCLFPAAENAGHRGGKDDQAPGEGPTVRVVPRGPTRSTAAIMGSSSNSRASLQGGHVAHAASHGDVGRPIRSTPEDRKWRTRSIVAAAVRPGEAMGRKSRSQQVTGDDGFGRVDRSPRPVHSTPEPAGDRDGQCP